MWVERNSRIFQSKPKSLAEIVSEIVYAVMMKIMALPKLQSILNLKWNVSKKFNVI